MDVCDRCNGLWFDPSELLSAIGGLKDKAIQDLPAGFFGELGKHARKRLCPCCSKSMNTISHKSVEIDYCRSCKGFWLDAGEVIAITRQFVALAGRSDVRSEAIRKFIKSLPEELQSIEVWSQSNRHALLHFQKELKLSSEDSFADNLVFLEAFLEFIIFLFPS